MPLYHDMPSLQARVYALRMLRFFTDPASGGQGDVPRHTAGRVPCCGFVPSAKNFAQSGRGTSTLDMGLASPSPPLQSKMINGYSKAKKRPLLRLECPDLGPGLPSDVELGRRRSLRVRSRSSISDCSCAKRIGKITDARSSQGQCEKLVKIQSGVSMYV